MHPRQAQAAAELSGTAMQTGEMASAVNLLAEQRGEPSPHTLMAATSLATEPCTPGALFLEFSADQR